MTADWHTQTFENSLFLLADLAQYETHRAVLKQLVFALGSFMIPEGVEIGKHFWNNCHSLHLSMLPKFVHVKTLFLAQAWALLPFLFTSFYLVLSFPEKFHHIPTFSILMCLAALTLGYYPFIFLSLCKLPSYKISYSVNAESTNAVLVVWMQPALAYERNTYAFSLHSVI